MPQMKKFIMETGVYIFLVSVGCSSKIPEATDQRPVVVSNIAPATNPETSTTDRPEITISITDAAAKMTRHFIGTDSGAFLRLGINGDSDAFNYSLTTDDAFDDDADIETRSNGVRMVIKSTDEPFFRNVTIDWVVQPDGTAGFKIDNPNTASVD
jgi:Fe-S cluster assembly iron-binding protein IscA